MMWCSRSRLALREAYLDAHDEENTQNTHNRTEKELGYTDVFGTAGGQCIFEYSDGTVEIHHFGY